MGHRANLFIVEDGKSQIYYCHWCALEFSKAFCWGPEIAREYIRQFTPVGLTLGDSCEAAVLLDLDSKVLLFFSTEYFTFELPLVRTLLSLIKENWPGWEVRWAHEGIFSIAEYLNLPKEPLRDWGRPKPGQKFRPLPPDIPPSGALLLTLRHQGRTAVFRGMLDAENDTAFLETGPAVLDDVRSAEGATSLVWDGEFPPFPLGGGHVDFDRRELAFWCVMINAPIEYVVTAWAGWNVKWLQDSYENHLTLAGLDIRLPSPSPQEMRKQMLTYIGSRDDWEDIDPTREPRILGRPPASLIGEPDSFRWMFSETTGIVEASLKALKRRFQRLLKKH